MIDYLLRLSLLVIGFKNTLKLLNRFLHTLEIESIENITRTEAYESFGMTFSTNVDLFIVQTSNGELLIGTEEMIMELLLDY